MTEVVNIEAATAEVENWLDSRKVMPSQRTSNEEAINVLIEAVQYGLLTIKDGAFTQVLNFPLGASESIKSLTYKARINNVMLEPHMRGVKPTDGFALLNAYLACMTDQPKQILKSMEPADSRIANSIVGFFLG